jgi:hypothetical protein
MHDGEEVEEYREGCGWEGGLTIIIGVGDGGRFLWSILLIIPLRSSSTLPIPLCLSSEAPTSFYRLPR